MEISNFVQVRVDGKLIPQGMTVKIMLELGWQPAKVVALRWDWGSQQIEFAPPRPLHATVVRGQTFVAAIMEGELASQAGRLVVVNPDGSIHGSLDNRLDVAGQTSAGQFGWFEPAMTAGANIFGAVFQTSAGDDLRCDIDANEVKVLRTALIR